jgi:phosphatidate cytidylyltransferase
VAHPDDSRKPQNEGVRLIGADEAAEAFERQDVARRRPDDAPRLGDRPPSPDLGGPRPTIRFPLPADEDPPPLSAAAPVPPPDPDAGDTGGDDTALPHWTAPATGEVPRIFAAADRPDDDTGTWSAFGSQPRWRGEGGTAADDDDGHDFSRLVGADAPMGALDDSERDPHDFFRFEDPEPSPVRGTFLGEPEPYRAPPDPYAADPYAADPYGDDPDAEPVAADDGYAGTWADPEPAAIGGRTRSISSDPRRAGDAGARRLGRPPGGGNGGGNGNGGGGGAGRPGRDVPVATAVGVGLVTLFLVSMAAGARFTVGLVTIILGVAAAELFSVLRKAGYQPATLLGIAATVTLPLAVYWRGEAGVPLVLFLTVVFGLLWYLVGAGGRDRPVLGLSSTLLGVAYVGVLGSYAALLLGVPTVGTGLLTGAILGAVGYDVGGFVVGRNAGSRPLSATSPNKTVEGLVGGMLFAVVFVVVPCVLFPGISPWDNFGDALLLGLVAAVAAPLGDLCESLLKRDLDVKDMGGLLPGHGGVLDRFDAILFVLPATYYLARILFA